MTTDHEITISSAPTMLTAFEFTPESIAKMGEPYLAMTCTDTATRTECGKARKTLVSTRTGIGKRQKELKQPLKDDMKRIDEAADLLVAALAPIEAHLDAQIEAYESTKKAEKEARELAEKQANEARIAAAMAEAEENARIAREAAEAKIAAERAELEREKAELARHRAAIEAERVKAEEAARAERERAEAAAKEERERIANEQTERDRIAAAKQAENERLLAEAKAKIDADRKALEAEIARVEAARIAQERAEAARVAAAQAEEDRLARDEAERVAVAPSVSFTIDRPLEFYTDGPLPAIELDGPTLVDVAIPVDAESLTDEQSDAAKLVAWLDAIEELPRPEMVTNEGINEAYEIMVKIGLADALARDFLARSKGESF